MPLSSKVAGDDQLDRFSNIGTDDLFGDTETTGCLKSLILPEHFLFSV